MFAATLVPRGGLGPASAVGRTPCLWEPCAPFLGNVN